MLAYSKESNIQNSNNYFRNPHHCFHVRLKITLHAHNYWTTTSMNGKAAKSDFDIRNRSNHVTVVQLTWLFEIPTASICGRIITPLSPRQAKNKKAPSTRLGVEDCLPVLILLWSLWNWNSAGLAVKQLLRLRSQTWFSVCCMLAQLTDFSGYAWASSLWSALSLMSSLTINSTRRYVCLLTWQPPGATPIELGPFSSVLY